MLGRTPLHPQFFSKSFLSGEVRRNTKGLRGNVADLGCGFAPYKKFLKRARYYGLDYPDAMDCRQEKVVDIYGDLSALPLADRCLDGILCTQVLEHIKDPQTALKEMARVLKPGGKLILSAPFFYPLHDEPHDFFRYTPHGLNTLISVARLDIVSMRPQGGFITMVGEFLNLYLIHHLQKWIDTGRCLRILGYVAIIPFLIVSVLTNFLCLIFSPLDRERRFVMNYFIVAKKGEHEKEQSIL